MELDVLEGNARSTVDLACCVFFFVLLVGGYGLSLWPISELMLF